MSTPTSAAAAEKEADALRAALGETIGQLKTNLKPSQLAHEAMVSSREHTPDWLVRYWDVARSPIGLIVIGLASGGLIGSLTPLPRRPRRWR